MEVSHIVYVRKKSTSGVGYLTPSQYVQSSVMVFVIHKIFALQFLA